MPNLPKPLKSTGGKKISRPRKYRTNDSRWLKIRKAQLQREPLCRDCARKGLTKAANTVDHVDGNTWNNSESNLQSLCHACHNRKGIRHDGLLGHKRKQ